MYPDTNDLAVEVSEIFFLDKKKAVANVASKILFLG